MASLRSLWNPFLKTERPNIRKMFIPDPEHIILEADLKQADAQCVAGYAGDAELIEIFTRMNNGEDIDVHKENAKVCFSVTDVSKWQRQIAKHVVHGTNFTGSSYEIARRLGLLRHQVDVFQKRWFGAHPKIKTWHSSVEHELMRTRCVSNVFGRRVMFFDRIEHILPEAVAWIAQSTTALTINAGIRNVERELKELSLLIQVHDSGLWQTPIACYTPELRKTLKQCLSIPLAFTPRPLIIGVDLSISTKSWGDVEKTKWT
jgi:DNA polymerase I-like protein with 3'-5' exonuclease and polymerase domains